MNATPIFNKKKMMFYREEHNGYVSIIPPGKPTVERKLLNLTTVEILNEVDGRNTLSNICDEFVKRHPSIPIETLKMDLLFIIYELWANSIIDWKKGENPFMSKYVRELDSGNGLIRIAFEEDTRRLMQFYEDSEGDACNRYSNALLPVDFKMPLLMRYSMFSLNYVYFICERDNKIESTIVMNLDKISSVATIESVDNWNNNFPYYFQKLEELLDEFSIKKYTKIRAILRPNEDNEFRKELLRARFSPIAILEKEIDNSNVELMEYFLN